MRLRSVVAVSGGGELREALLPQLADITGGQSFTASNTGRLASAFTRIVKEFRTRPMSARS